MNVYKTSRENEVFLLDARHREVLEKTLDHKALSFVSGDIAYTKKPECKLYTATDGHVQMRTGEDVLSQGTGSSKTKSVAVLPIQGALDFGS